jgi:hypothetical protein
MKTKLDFCEKCLTIQITFTVNKQMSTHTYVRANHDTFVVIVPLMVVYIYLQGPSILEQPEPVATFQTTYTVRRAETVINCSHITLKT